MSTQQLFNIEQELNTFFEKKIPYYKQRYSGVGAPAAYIPELKNTNPDYLACALMFPDGQVILKGDYAVPFTLQSIAKVFIFMTACMHLGTSRVLEWVDVEPTGDPFNSILRFELNENKKPFNPMINAGAITVASLLPGTDSTEKIEKVKLLLSAILDKDVSINEKIFISEWETAYRNRALANFLMENHLLAADVEETLLTYTKLCSIEITAEDLAKIGLVLSIDGFDPIRRIEVIPSSIARFTKILMFTCGMYNYSGKFAAYVGIPGKSGVSGGILGTVPPSFRNHPILSDGCGIGIFSPAIDPCGNSVKGIKLLEDFLHSYSVQIF
ncbi:glutaminase A [Cytobacillus depressus]|uniref:Glutaminase n=1 Tax=Cytobacillus depressus TaxID=1602942 RepID=A0A6L3V5I1_9BACI|nr:glutaminase A [Cytobacillus depressus]KAB2334493.1 glutaminase A [Cytobacillus depressus]